MQLSLSPEHKDALDWYERLDEELPTNLEGALQWIYESCGSHEKLPAILYLHGQMGFRNEWLRLLGELWSSCDTNQVVTGALVWIFREWLDQPETVIPELMNEREWAAFNALPAQITIYRGCGLRNKAGLSWSLSREVAERFPFIPRYRADQPILLTATISKQRVAAIKLERGEDEIIVIGLTAADWSEEYLTEPPRPLDDVAGERQP